MKRRIYADTSVIGGCLDAEFEQASRPLMNAFERGDAIMVLSDLTELELQAAPAAVRALAERVPHAHREHVKMTSEADALADRYIEVGAIGLANRIDAGHIALATINHVSALASWNFRHIVNLWRIQAYNSVNLREGYSMLEIRTPRELVMDHDEG